MTSVAKATVLCNLTPVVVTAFAWLVLKERPGKLFVVALILAMAGAFAMAAAASSSARITIIRAVLEAASNSSRSSRTRLLLRIRGTPRHQLVVSEALILNLRSKSVTRNYSTNSIERQGS